MTNVLEVYKIYINENVVFEKDVDYVIERENKTIRWTTIGLQKIQPGVRFYASVIKKVEVKVKNSQTFNVTKIEGKYATIVPAITENLFENTTFSYETDTYNLLPYEIADIGKIEIEIV